LRKNNSSHKKSSSKECVGKNGLMEAMHPKPSKA
jgi:hypothetical protein